MEQPGHDYYMRLALKEAETAYSKGEVPVGAVVVCSGKTIARTHNLTELLTDATAHAEMQAITAASNLLGGKYLTDCTLYVTLEPCVMCAGALSWAQVGKIVYGAPDEKRGYSTVSRHILHPKTEVTGGILEAECSQLIKRFFAGKR